MSKKMRAEITLTPALEGGFSSPPASGIRPQLAVGDVFTSCVVRSLDGKETLPLGEPVTVEVEIIFWEEYKGKFTEGMPVVLHDGSRIVAKGHFVEGDWDK